MNMYMNEDIALEMLNTKNSDIYDYSLTKYINSKTAIKIICKKCSNIFERRFYNHYYRNQGCDCYYHNKKYTKETFIETSKSIYGDKWNYDRVVYINNNSPVIITCNKHINSDIQIIVKCFFKGNLECIRCKRDEQAIIFEKRASIKYNNQFEYHLDNYINRNTEIEIKCLKHSHSFSLSGRQHLNKMFGGCGYCKDEYKKDKLINDLNIVHNNYYKYDDIYNVDFINIKRGTINVECPRHGYFEIGIQNHLSGTGCNKCSNHTKYNTEIFIAESIVVHNGLYTYDNTVYINQRTPVLITCKRHKDFSQLPPNHLTGSGCPTCRLSKGELRISEFLKDNDIHYESEYKFEYCKYKYKLPFDFYLSDFNICIEYDGKQHFESVKYYGGMDSFDVRKEKDNIRNEYCKKNNIKLIRIPYWDFDNIEEILEREIK